MPDLTNEATTRIIRRLTQSAIDNRMFIQADFEDIAQEITLAILEQQERFDPEISRWSTFVTTIARGTIVSLFRHKKAQRRGGGVPQRSLEAISNKSMESLRDSIVEDRRRSSGRAVDDEVRLDLAAAIESLPQELRDIAEPLQHDSLADVGRRLGLSRAVVLKRVAEIRQHFARLGLEDYLCQDN